MKNKKGFTLVELLAVIVILAVIILIAVNAVLPQMNRARKNSFADEAMNYLKAAETKYVEGALNTTTEGSTVTIGVDTDLNGAYVSKTKGSYKGNITLTIATTGDNAGNVTNKSINLTDCKKYMIVNGSGTIEGTDVQAYSASTWNAITGIEQCGSESTDEPTEP